MLQEGGVCASSPSFRSSGDDDVEGGLSPTSFTQQQLEEGSALKWSLLFFIWSAGGCYSLLASCRRGTGGLGGGSWRVVCVHASVGAAAPALACFRRWRVHSKTRGATAAVSRSGRERGG